VRRAVGGIARYVAALKKNGAKMKLKVCFDSVGGAARGHSDDALRQAGVNVETVHD
jgi:phosphomannomutase